MGEVMSSTYTAVASTSESVCEASGQFARVHVLGTELRTTDMACQNFIGAE